MKPQKPETYYGPIDSSRFYKTWKGEYIESVLISDVGKKRHNNEDSCLLFIPHDETLEQSRGILFAVADGMGGASAGEYASRKTLECVCNKYFDKSLHYLVPIALRAAVEVANEVIYKEADLRPEFAGMGTTLSALAILGNWAYMAQVGDSRIYLLRTGYKIKQITHDHSLVAEQIRNGLLNAKDAKNHSLRNLITRAVGIRDTIEVDLFAVELQKGDRLFLCSDGLSNMVPDDLLEELLSTNDLESAASQLMQKALDAGGVDNITLVCIHIYNTPPPSHYQAGAKLFSFKKSKFVPRLFKFLPKNP